MIKKEVSKVSLMEREIFYEALKGLDLTIGSPNGEWIDNNVFHPGFKPYEVTILSKRHRFTIPFGAFKIGIGRPQISILARIEIPYLLDLHFTPNRKVVNENDKKCVVTFYGNATDDIVQKVKTFVERLRSYGVISNVEFMKTHQMLRGYSWWGEAHDYY